MHSLVRPCPPQDVSRLLDLCRQSIVFGDLFAVADCLRAIAADSDVRLARIRNKMDPAFDSRSSAGYRDLAVSFRVSPAGPDGGMEGWRR